MITRVVKLTFQPSFTDEFLELFELIEHKIRSFPGCKKLQLFRDFNNPNVFFTISIWESASDLDNYRKSAFFDSTWTKIKTNFSTPAEAWSLFEHVINE